MLLRLSKSWFVVVLMCSTVALASQSTEEDDLHSSLEEVVTLENDIGIDGYVNLDVYPVEGPPDHETMVSPKVRYSIEYLVERWENGEKKPLNNLLKGFKLLQERDVTDEASFQYIGGIHGQPFFTRKGKTHREYWGGYCQHSNILFPVWHRAYVLYLEKALQTVLNDTSVRMAYWNEIGEDTIKYGVPTIFTYDWVWIDGEAENNPLKNFTFDMKYLQDVSPVEDSEMYFYQNYTTVRYPMFHSDVGGQEQQQAAAELNKRYTKGTALQTLNHNVALWMNGSPSLKADAGEHYTTKEKYEACLTIDEYTYFSNSVSGSKYQSTSHKTIWPLERPHNDVHNAVGASSAPLFPEQHAFGDMGYLEFASFDPIFYFHHCFVDMMFWKWQTLHGSTEELKIINGYPGTFSSGHKEKGPTPGFNFGEPLNMDSPLYPFKKADTVSYQTGNDVTDITKLGYKYEDKAELKAVPVRSPKPGYEALAKKMSAQLGVTRSMIKVSHVDGTIIDGPFTIIVYIKTSTGKFYVGHDTVFSRMPSKACEECAVSRFFEFFFPLDTVHPAVVYSQVAEIVVEFSGKIRPGKKLDYQAEFVA